MRRCFARRRRTRTPGRGARTRGAAACARVRAGLGGTPEASLTPGGSAGLRGTGTLKDAVEPAEREAITAALAAAGGNRREAAKRLGVSLRTLFYKMDRYRID